MTSRPMPHFCSTSLPASHHFGAETQSKSYLFKTLCLSVSVV